MLWGTSLVFSTRADRVTIACPYPVIRGIQRCTASICTKARKLVFPLYCNRSKLFAPLWYNSRALYRCFAGQSKQKSLLILIHCPPTKVNMHVLKSLKGHRPACYFNCAVTVSEKPFFYFFQYSHNSIIRAKCCPQAQ